MRGFRPGWLVVVFCLFLVQGVLAFDIPTHRNVTTEELREITASAGGDEVMISERALEEIADANEDVDDALSAALFRPERHFTNEQFAAASARLMNLKTQIVNLVTADPPNGQRARQRLGQALHTVQDFYSHSTWVELGNTAINTNLGRSMMNNPAANVQPCPTDSSMVGPGAGGSVSSAYFICNACGCTENFCLLGVGARTLPAGKCLHGNYTTVCPGINKDRATPADPTSTSIRFCSGEPAPASGRHAEAVAVARLATTDYVEQVLQELAGNDDAIRSLLDVRGSIGFVVDDTGSMGPEINGVKTVITGIVNALDLFPFSRPDSWLLERFGDPDVGPVYVTESAEDLLARVDALIASGGGDCPEKSQAALLEAVNASNQSSKLFFFSDASAKDSSLQNAVISLAQDRSVKLIYLLTGTCSPIDPAYLRGAAETGGQLFLIFPSEVPLAFDLVEPILSGDLVTLRSEMGELPPGGEMVDVLVDSTVSRLVVSAYLEVKTDVALRRPTGELVDPSDPDVRISDLTSGCILTVEDPAPGIWQAELVGSGSYSLVADGNSPLEFRRFDFVEPGGDVHGGYFPISGQPLAGSEIVGEAVLLGPFADVDFDLVDEIGESIGSAELVQNFPEASPDHFLGPISLPAVPFRVVAKGQDQNGFPFERPFASVYRAQVVSVEVQGDEIASVPAGETSVFEFTVTNLGPATSYVVAAGTTFGAITNVQPVSVFLEQDASETITVDLSIPADAPEGTTLALTVTATQAGNSSVFNSATVDVTVQEEDTTPPMVTCSAIPESMGDEASDEPGYRRVTVQFDAVDESPIVELMAMVELAASPDDEAGDEVDDEDADETPEDTCLPFVVDSGQLLSLICGEKNCRVFTDDEATDMSVNVHTGEAVLTVTAVDEVGNSAACQVDLCNDRELLPPALEFQVEDATSPGGFRGLERATDPSDATDPASAESDELPAESKSKGHRSYRR